MRLKNICFMAITTILCTSVLNWGLVQSDKTSKTTGIINTNGEEIKNLQRKDYLALEVYTSELI